MTHPTGDRSWRHDTVTSRSGTVIPVRGTSRRLQWHDLPSAVRGTVTALAGSDVVRATSTSTGFTAGFASRLDLADGRAVFVKAASTSLDSRVGWEITSAYREEIRKLSALPPGVPAPRLIWSTDQLIEDTAWVLLGLEAVDGRPPRRPWQPAELCLVCEALAAMASDVAVAPAALQLDSFLAEFGGVDEWVAEVASRDGSSDWLDAVADLAQRSLDVCSGTALAHLDLRDDNLLIDTGGRVWICDWNWPLVAAPWLDLVTLLLSAHGDGLDADAIVAAHPLTRGVPPADVDAWLANLWLYFTTAKDRPIPESSPHLRDHQAWYDEATADWLVTRLTRRLGPMAGAPAHQ